MALDAFRLQHPLRVRWSEVDPQGIVFNSHYLMYCDVAITEYWRALRLVYPSGLLELGVDTVVARATLSYAAAARYDDELVVGIRCAAIGRTSLRVESEITREGAALVSAELIYVTVTADSHQPVPVPGAVTQAIEDFEITPPERARRSAG